ncbi:conserved hypothetical protein [Ricinus communis]|uniref:Uncharacterized protein n=1 Tax=Ricinus communis TaxID=3988 RepID=B9RIA8_RICCO|nr:conserved hypothetical protein [Ricinus communis]
MGDEDQISTLDNNSQLFVLSDPLLFSSKEKCNSLTQLKQIQAQMIGLITEGLAQYQSLERLDYCTIILCNAQKRIAFSWNVATRGYLGVKTLGKP